ncbi:hypothetical protein Pcinc_005314 [Petrolisthes cinctipes]|uniref:Large ribosomal subunit protein mL45 n=1 Tax=Petrolisthes cinctipes TaxID=88211 RepID=A0AAE1L2U1_PETCI|nr:hypothetical protein Pcinc_005314 [Petrolisthes cinctipes]
MAASRVPVICRFSQFTVKPVCAASSCLISEPRTSYICNYPNHKYFGTSTGLSGKHYNPKFKRDRKLKYIKIDFPNLSENKDVEDMTQDEIRAKMKEKGIQPVRPWQEKPLFISSTSDTFEVYVPPEGDGKISVTTAAGAKQKLELIGKKGKSMMAIRELRQFDEDFEANEFAEEAQQTYINTHEALIKLDEDRLHQLVTERAYPGVVHEVKHKTVRWQFVKSLEPPRVVHVRCTNMITKENVFAQVTVRFHTQQILAVYDRFGRLQYGSEVVARDVLEYVVFEKHVANTYGTWRIHDKIIPDWLPPRSAIHRTYRKEKQEESEESAETKSTEVLQKPATEHTAAATN